MSHPPYGRVAVFIDGANFYHTIRDLQLHVDYRRLRHYFDDRGTLVRAHYYTPLLPNNQSPDWLIRLTDWLAYNGYQVITKPAQLVPRRFTSEDGEEHWTLESKGNTDIEIVVDTLALANHCDTIVLATGSSAFLYLVEALQRQGCRVVVLSSQKTAEVTVADELRRQADQFLEIADLAEEIGMNNGSPHSSKAE